MNYISSFAVASAMALSAGILSAQDSGVVLSGAVPVGGVSSGGGQVITLGAGTNGLDVGALSKAIQDGLKQVLGSQGTNLSLGGGSGGFDPAKMMQHFQERRMDSIREQMGFTDDTEWEAVKSLVQKVMDLQQERQMSGGMMRARGLGLGGGVGAFGKGFGSSFQMPECPEQEALQKAVDDNAPAAQVREVIAKYRAWQKAQQAKLEAAQSDLRKILTAKQEAKAILLGLLN